MRQEGGEGREGRGGGGVGLGVRQEGGEGREGGEEEEGVAGCETERRGREGGDEEVGVAGCETGRRGRETGERRRRGWLGVRQEGGEGREGGEERGVEGKVQMEEGQADLVTTICPG